MRKEIYKGPIFTLEQFEVSINGKKYLRDVLDHKAAVGILVKKDDKFIFVKQMRYGIMQKTLEIPAGLIDSDEDMYEASSRELQEEIGLKPIKLEYFYSLYSVPAYCNEVVHLFYADKFTSSILPQDDDEQIEIVKMTESEVLEELSKPNSLFDMKTVIALQHYLLKIKPDKV